MATATRTTRTRKAATPVRPPLSGEVVFTIAASEADGDTLAELLTAALAVHPGVTARFAFFATDADGIELGQVAVTNGAAVTDDAEDDVEDIDEEEADEEAADDEEEEEADDEAPYTEADLKALPLADLKALAEEYDINLDTTKGKPKLVAAILEAQAADADDEDPEAEDEEEDDEEEAEEEDDAEEEEEDDEEEAGVTEDDLRAMPLAELKAFAREQNLRITKGMTADAIIEALMATAEEDDE